MSSPYTAPLLRETMETSAHNEQSAGRAAY